MAIVTLISFMPAWRIRPQPHRFAEPYSGRTAALRLCADIRIHQPLDRASKRISAHSASEAFGLTLEEIRAEMVPSNFIGRAPSQVTELLENDVRPILEKYKDLLGLEVEIKV